MRQTQESLRRLKKGRQGFSLWSNRSTNEDVAANEEANVRAQMQIDVQVFFSESNALSANVEDGKGFNALRTSIAADQGPI